jgi:hypothetical protein
LNLTEVVVSLGAGAVSAASLFALGWPVAAASGTRFALAGSWIAGLCLLYGATFLCQIAGLPLHLPVVATVAGTLSVVAWLIGRRWTCSQTHQDQACLKMPHGFALVLLAAVVLVFAFRAFLQPLQGADTLFRWEFLARVLLFEGNLDFYPPRSAEDFDIYFYPDGMSPLAALCHWWVYAIRGTRDPAATYAVVTSSYVVSMLLIAGIAAGVAGGRGATGALYAAIGSPILFWAFVQGQETGLMSLGVLGGAYYLRLNSGTRGSAFMAGLCLALACLAREYGAALAAAVMAAAFLARSPVKWGVLLSTVALLGGSWYVRNWTLSGNPFYSLSFAGLFPTNPVLEGMLLSCKQSVGWEALGIHGAIKAAGHILQLASLPIVVVGLCLLRPRNHAWVLCPAIVGLAVWAHSVNYTSGGLVYSYRVLGPAVALGAAACGIVFAQIAGRANPANRWQFVWPLMAIYGLVNSLTMPSLAKSVAPEDWLTQAFAPKRADRGAGAMVYRHAKVLSDNAYLHAMARGNDQGFQVVSLWSPAFAFLFDASWSDEEKKRRLHSLGITHATDHGSDSVYWNFYAQHSLFREAFTQWSRDGGYVLIPPQVPVHQRGTLLPEKGAP